MNKNNVYRRTSLGNGLLDNPRGRIPGDEMLLLALFDGRRNIEAIIKKVPPSVHIHLEEIFARMLSTKIIVEADSDETDSLPEGLSEAANKRCADLEQELAYVRLELEPIKARMKEVEVGFHKLRLRVSTYTEITHARLSKCMKELGAASADELREVYENELREMIESLKPLNQVIADQKKILDSTLRMKVYQGQPSAGQLQKDRENQEAKMAYSHPLYKRLRGLEFFRGFANAELLQFLTITKWLEANAGITVLNEGDVGMPFFIIVSGTAAVFKGKNRLATLNEGDFFGEFAYLSGEEPYRSARVVAETECEFLEVDPLEIEFSPVQFRLHVVEALLRGQVRRTLISPGNSPSDSMSSEMDTASP